MDISIKMCDMSNDNRKKKMKKKRVSTSNNVCNNLKHLLMEHVSVIVNGVKCIPM